MDRADQLINQANGRLKAGHIGVTIRRRGNRLSLQATLPPKPGSSQAKPRSQPIALGINASVEGVSEAERQAKRLGSAIASGTFDWSDWGAKKAQPTNTVGEWRERFFEEFPKQRKLKNSSWRSMYLNPILRLDESQELNAENLRTFIIEASKPDSQSRRKLCYAYRNLARFAGLEMDIDDIIGDYNAKAVDPRNLPSDEEIVQVWASIRDPHWKQAFAIQITYGLRNHGCYRAIVQPDFYIEVVEKGAPEPRIVPPLYPEWVDLFQLFQVPLPKHDASRENEVLGAWHSQRLRRGHKIPFPPHAGRHCYARRAYEFGFSADDAARMMGHSVDVHKETYQRWFGDEVYKRSYDAIAKDSDRPRPPLTTR